MRVNCSFSALSPRPLPDAKLVPPGRQPSPRLGTGREGSPLPNPGWALLGRPLLPRLPSICPPPAPAWLPDVPAAASLCGEPRLLINVDAKGAAFQAQPQSRSWHIFQTLFNNLSSFNHKNN